jgi:hypothetical protein
MSKQLVEIVLPRLAQRLQRQLKRYRAGELSETQFTERFEGLLQKQYAWLSDRGVPEEEAALAIHGAVLVLSGPGLRAEAEETGVPLEVVEHRAVCAAAADIATNYNLDVRDTTKRISTILARYGE